MADRPTWHPRQLARPVSWVLEYALVTFATITQTTDPHTGARSYETRTAAGRLIGTYSTGDEASTAAWEWFLQDRREDHQHAARRGHELDNAEAADPDQPY